VTSLDRVLDAAPQQAAIRITMTKSEAQELRVTTGWLLRALADRPTTPTEQRGPHAAARVALQRLSAALGRQLASHGPNEDRG
jgi:hypothetical protein